MQERIFNFYDGALGYESFVCKWCGFDVNDVNISHLDKLFEMFKELQDGQN